MPCEYRSQLHSPFNAIDSPPFLPLPFLSPGEVSIIPTTNMKAMRSRWYFSEGVGSHYDSSSFFL